MGAPLLAASDLRLDVRGVAAIDGLSFTTDRVRVIVVGAPRVLFEAVCGVARPSRGSLQVQGASCVDALAAGGVAGAAVDAPMPADWTPLAYATWSARLAGLGGGDARARATSAIERLGLGPHLATELGKAPLAVKRATSIAAALATGARVIALEDPTSSLDDEAAHALGTLVVGALADRAWLLFAARAPLASALVASAEEALVVAGSALVERGAPGELASRGRRYAVDAQGAGDALALAIAARGAQVNSLVSAPGSARFVVELAEGSTTRDLFACAAEVGAVVVELRPIARAFA